MSNPAPQPPRAPDRPFQFTLREAAIVSLGLCFLLALVFQWGFWGVVTFLVIAAIGVLCYGTYWGEWKLATPAAGFLLCAACAGSLDFSAHREGGPPPKCQHKLKGIGIALHNYADEHGSFPPPYIADASGKPMHSWRVLLLPFIEQQELYERYDFSEPWDGPNNIKLAGEIPNIYRCSDLPRASTTNTAFLAVIGSETMWRLEAPATLADIKDGAAKTLAVVEVENSGVNWLEPMDLDLSQMPLAIKPKQGLGVSSPHRHEKAQQEGAWGLCVDGSVHFLPTDLSSATLRGLFTIAGGENVQVPRD